jgi:hypothetical protein
MAQTTRNISRANWTPAPVCLRPAAPERKIERGFPLGRIMDRDAAA